MMDLSSHTSAQLARWTALAFGTAPGSVQERMDAKAQISRMIGLGAFVRPTAGVRMLLGRADVAPSGPRACAADGYLAERRRQPQPRTVPAAPESRRVAAPGRPTDYSAAGAPRPVATQEVSPQDAFRMHFGLFRRPR
jgi:hypothetical protein